MASQVYVSAPSSSFEAHETNPDLLSLQQHLKHSTDVARRPAAAVALHDWRVLDDPLAFEPDGPADAPCTAKRVAEICRPLAWANYMFGRYNIEPREATKTLQEDPETRKLIRYAYWEIRKPKQRFPFALLPKLDNLQVLRIILLTQGDYATLSREVLRKLRITSLSINHGSEIADRTFYFADHMPALRQLDATYCAGDLLLKGWQILQCFKTSCSPAEVVTTLPDLRRLALTNNWTELADLICSTPFEQVRQVP